MGDKETVCKSNPFMDGKLENNPIAKRIVMNVRKHKKGSLAVKINKHYIGEDTSCEFYLDDLGLNKWCVIMRWIPADFKREDISEWRWQLYKTVSVVQSGDLYAKKHYSESYLIIGDFDSEEEARNLCAYLKTRFVVFLVAHKQVKKLSQKHPKRELTWNSFEYVPVKDFSKPWTDAELYKEYELEQDEIAFIESNIKAFDEEG